MHQLGTAIQDLGPLDGSGLVVDGLAVCCGSCSGRFMVERQKAIGELGSSIWDIKQTEPLHCPYCGVKDGCKVDRAWMTDTRPRGSDY